jgi:hypothetical protein
VQIALASASFSRDTIAAINTFVQLSSRDLASRTAHRKTGEALEFKL